MKALKLLTIGTLLFFFIQSKAQFPEQTKTPPPWGLAGLTETRYYYLPGIESYYDIETSQFLYRSKGSWVSRSTLPVRYRKYNLYKGYKAVMTDYHVNAPYTHFEDHKKKYPKKYKGASQKTIGDRASF
jgi:hypothetical protein